MNEDKLIKIINNLSYTDFVGEINQWNTLPGSYITLNKWINFSNLNSNSRYLDVACTTGIKSRTISELTGCKALGVDISKKSIQSAIFNKEMYTPEADVEYHNIDATKFHPKEKFSHISFGASLRFFDNPKKMLEHSLKDLLSTNGFYWLRNFM